MLLVVCVFTASFIMTHESVEPRVSFSRVYECVFKMISLSFTTETLLSCNQTDVVVQTVTGLSTVTNQTQPDY